MRGIQRGLAATDAHHFRDALVREALVLGRRIADGDDAGIVQRETTITETTLLNLHQGLGDRLRIMTLTQNEEGDKGADWIWCVGGPGGWFTFWVQAKKLKNDVYDIGYRRKGKRRQIDALIDAAQKVDALPVHVLFNPTRPGRRYSTRPCVAEYSVGADSFTVVPSLAARALLGSRRATHVHLDEMAVHAHPWACMAGCPPDLPCWDGGQWPDGFPDPQFPLDIPRNAGGAFARVLTAQTIETLDWVREFELPQGPALRGQEDLARSIAISAYSSREPGWLDSPQDVLHFALDDMRGAISAPVAIVTQWIEDGESPHVY